MSTYRTFNGEQNLLLNENRQAMMEKGLLSPTRDGQKSYPTPLSLPWRLFHWLMYFNGGVTFFIGSFLLFSTINAAYPSALLYTFGSATFLVADITEWLTNNHVGCFWYEKYEDSYEESVEKSFAPKERIEGQLQRAEVGINFFLSSIGSFFYLVGSSLFLPQVYAPVTALVCFMIASSCIILAQCWKVYRGGLAPESSESNARSPPRMIYSIQNYKADFSGFLVDFFVIFGAMCYLIGSPLFFPNVDTNSQINDTAATIFTFGGIFYMLSGSSMFYRYMFTTNFPH